MQVNLKCRLIINLPETVITLCSFLSVDTKIKGPSVRDPLYFKRLKTEFQMMALRFSR